MRSISNFFKFIKNKYILSGLAFILWIIFFDHYNLFRYLDYRSEYNEIKQKKAYYQEQIGKTKKDLEQIKTNPFWLEKIAREQYLMKRSGEDIFISREEK